MPKQNGSLEITPFINYFLVIQYKNIKITNMSDAITFTIKKALENEGWTITHDPYPLKIGRKSAEIDLGAERIEIKSFIQSSAITAFYHALGQFELYERALKIHEPDRVLYLALPQEAYEELLLDIFNFEGFTDLKKQLIVLKPNHNLLWIKP